MDTLQCDSTKTLNCPLVGNNAGICTCENLFYWEALLEKCVEQKTNNGSCNSTLECRVDLGLICELNNTCTCSSNSYWSGSNCGIYIFELIENFIFYLFCFSSKSPCWR
jgi:hypothetical protein